MYKSAPFFFLRHSLVSNEDLNKIISSLNKKKDLLDYYKKNPRFRLSIAIASPKLYQSLKKDLENGSFKNHQNYLSLLKYLLRSSTRTTPFGLFASVAYGRFGNRLELFEDDKIIKKIRPDMSWVSHSLKELFDNVKKLKNFKLMTNPSVILKGSKFYLLEQLSNSNEPKLLTIVASNYSKFVLKTGSYSIEYQKLLNLILKSYKKKSKKKIEKSLFELIEKGFLITDISVSLKDCGFFQETIKNFEKYNIEKYIPNTKLLTELFNNFETGTDEQSIQALEKIYNLLELSKTLPYPVQVDSARKKIISLPNEISKKIELIPQLLSSFQNINFESEGVQKFHSEFLEVFGVDTLVPVKLAIERIDYIPSEKKDFDKKNLLTSLILKKASQCDQYKIEISDEDGEKLLSNLDEEKLPSSCEVFFEILAPSQTCLEKGNYTILLNPYLATNQAISSFGRFLYLFNKSVHKDIKNFLKIEEKNNPDIVFVEASFLPVSCRTANVALFKPLRNHYLGFEYQENSPKFLNLDDIFIGANLNYLYIFSKKLNKKLHISLNSAVNDNLAPFPLKLLIDISNSWSININPFPWFTSSKETYLPELRYKNIIFSPRRWLIRDKDLIKTNVGFNKKELLRKDFEKRKIPSDVLLCLYDHRLRLDWKSNDDFDIIYQQFLSKNEVILFESLHKKYGIPFNFGDQNFTSEVSVSFILERKIKNKNFDKSHEYYSLHNNRFLNFNSNCIYVKLYLNRDQQTEFIDEYISSFINHLTENDLLSHWFFIRYYDSRDHIRLRLFSTDKLKVFNELSSKSNIWFQEGLIKDLSLNIYERELERYGGEECIDSIEKFFCVDSILSVEFLKKIKIQNKEIYPLFSIASINILILVFSFLEDVDLCINFLAYSKIEKSYLTGIREFYKPLIQYASNIILKKISFSEEDEFLLSMLPIFESFKNYSFQLSDEIKSKNLSKQQLWRLIDSLIHMHCNRLMGLDNNLEKKARVFSEFLAKKIQYLDSYLCV